MPQYTIPQFLDIEPKIFGPITLRQFVIIMVTMIGDFIIYRIFINNLIILAIIALPFTLFAALLAFKKVNGRPMHIFLLSLLRSIRRPGLRVWSKELTDKEIRELIADVEEKGPEKEILPQKEPLSGSRLTELSLIVNTGGVYHPEDEKKIEEPTVKQPAELKRNIKEKR